MRQNFDFVTMTDYENDTRELADRAAEIITTLRHKEQRLERMLAEIVLAAGGKVTIFDSNLARLDAPKLEFWRNDATMTVELRAERPER